MILELCTDSIAGAELARKYGAKRIELCSALTVGGLSPSTALIKECLKIGKVEVHVMLRHREGGFVYGKNEWPIILNDLNMMISLGVHGVVFGALNENGDVDKALCQEIISRTSAVGIEATFHRAFDLASDPIKTVEELIELGFDRLLTSGQKDMAIDGKNLIKDLSDQSDGRIQIMAGSGVNPSNAIELAATGADALHFTSHTTQGSGSLGMGANFIPDPAKISSIRSLFS